MNDLEEMLQTVDLFADTMKGKLIKKAKEGRSGGLLPENREHVAGLLVEHVLRTPLMAGQEVDIANLAMMLWASRINETSVK